MSLTVWLCLSLMATMARRAMWDRDSLDFGPLYFDVLPVREAPRWGAALRQAAGDSRRVAGFASASSRRTRVGVTGQHVYGGERVPKGSLTVCSYSPCTYPLQTAAHRPRVIVLTVLCVGSPDPFTDGGKGDAGISTVSPVLRSR
ncbi:hypothetical protein NDU88_007045 [Pleurodeles waltl]|uniref:Secreted protein n=1 Tax=Pleurodeles waltl TaxID=8319 RepID=A0AAV7TZJ2_PLEWA|nr:hypothetical protein NDU88_007045 [Pleurodeles waltl]